MNYALFIRTIAGRLAVTALFLTFSFLSAQAASFVVTKTADTNDGICNADCSLREAIGAANAAASNDVIEFDTTVFGTAQTITLSGTQLQINNNGSLTINGTGMNLLTINGNDASRVLFVNTGAAATINNLKLTNGHIRIMVSVDAIGGGIYNKGTTVISNVLITGNRGGGAGGGFFNDFGSSLTLNDSTVSLNTTGGGGGGGINSGTLNINNSVINNNTAEINGNGGGINNHLGEMFITNSSVMNNAAGSNADGGGIFNNSGEITITNTQINNNTAIDGAGIGGENFNGPAFVTMSGSTVNGNTATGNGGGLLGVGTLNISDTTFNNNSANFGGGILTGGTIVLTNVNLSYNTANQNGGGIYTNTLGLTLNNSYLANNTANNGGGIYVNGDTFGTLNVSDTVFQSNGAFTRGGGFYNHRGRINLTRVKIEHSLSPLGAGIYSTSISNPFTLTDSSVVYNQSTNNGGGIYLGGGTMSIVGSDVSNNILSSGSTIGGAGIFVEVATLNVTNSTISNNSSTKKGGGIYNLNFATVNLSSVTVAFNSSIEEGGGIYNSNSGTVRARNTIIGANYASNLDPISDFRGTLTSEGYNLIENTNGTTITGTTNGNILGQNPQLLPVRNNGGETPTTALFPSSPAVDAGDPNNFPATDQRGEPRPQDGDLEGAALPDIGAYERRLSIITVTKTADTNDGICDADCSLREAIAAANMAQTVDNAIIFDETAFDSQQTIQLTLGELSIGNKYSTLLIKGTGSKLLTVSGNNQSRVFFNAGGSVAMLKDLTVANGFAGLGLGAGGGILNNGGLGLKNLVVRNNTGNSLGGGIYNNGGGSLIIDKTIVKDNIAPSQGGGIGNSTGAAASITNSTVSGNQANDNGGGISSLGYLTMTNSTVSGNHSNQNGGGIYHAGIFTALSLFNATVAGNSAGQSGGGIYSGSQVVVRNSIIGDNTSLAANSAPDFYGNFLSQGYNLVENVTGTIFSGSTNGNILGSDPQFLPLGNYGGSTQTHALRPTSPAIDKGKSFGITTDQRGRTRPFDNPAIPNAPGGDGADIGAFERQSPDTPAGVVFDFDGDTKTDISIFRPAVGEWWFLRSSDGGNNAVQFGTSTDRLVPADFTGDGKTDIAFWRESSGEWFILRSEDNSFYAFPFGSNGDIPAPGDFDSDGKADAAVFRPSNATWYILRSLDGGVLSQQFGISEDQPVVADYDGDGKDDIGIYRPSVSEWWILRSSLGLKSLQFGASGDKTVQGDYTGDGKADIAFFRPSTGEWFVLRSEDDSFYAFPWGTVGDISAPGDYDGDGKFDAAVFRPSNSTWFLQKSTAGFTAIAFGTNGDVPIPNAFVR